MLPNFYVIGSSRSGTTTLRHHLRAHPDVYLPPVNEPRYFAFAMDPMNYAGPGDEILRDRVVTDMNAYQALFQDAGTETAIGEVSPAYLSSETAAARIAAATPDAKILAVLRHPAERALSSYRRERMDDLEPAPCLGAALHRENERQRTGWSYVWRYRYRGLYHTHLARYFARFPRHQIKVLTYDRWAGDQGRNLLREVFHFIGVDPAKYLPDRALHLNATTTPKEGDACQHTLAELHNFYRPQIELLQDLADVDLTGWL